MTKSRISQKQLELHGYNWQSIGFKFNWFVTLYVFNRVAVSKKWNSSLKRTFWAFHSLWSSKNGGITKFQFSKTIRVLQEKIKNVQNDTHSLFFLYK